MSGHPGGSNQGQRFGDLRASDEKRVGPAGFTTDRAAPTTINQGIKRYAHSSARVLVSCPSAAGYDLTFYTWSTVSQSWIEDSAYSLTSRTGPDVYEYPHDGRLFYVRVHNISSAGAGFTVSQYGHNRQR